MHIGHIRIFNHVFYETILPKSKTDILKMSVFHFRHRFFCTFFNYTIKKHKITVM